MFDWNKMRRNCERKVQVNVPMKNKTLDLFKKLYG